MVLNGKRRPCIGFLLVPCMLYGCIIVVFFLLSLSAISCVTSLALTLASFLMNVYCLLICTFLAMYREYEMVNKFTVECTVYGKSASRLPLCILRYDLIGEQLFVQRLFASNLRVITEVQHFLSFLESPHWRDTVKHSQHRYGSLFETDNVE